MILIFAGPFDVGAGAGGGGGGSGGAGTGLRDWIGD